MRKTLLAALLAAMAGPAARADTIEATSSTFLYMGQQTRNLQPGQEAELADVAPLFERLSISARGIRNPLAENLEIVLDIWGSYDLADLRWDNGTTSELTGDIVAGYVRGQFLKRSLDVRLGRMMVAQGAARFVQLDGGEVAVRLPAGFGLSGYVGSPVSQRFQSRGATVSWNPAGGDLAYGGRASWGFAIPGVAGRGFEIGGLYSMVTDSGETAHQQVGGDFRLQPIGNLTLSGYGLVELGEEATELAESNVQLGWTFLPKWHVTANWRYTRPDLMLSRQSILWVFADAERNDIGAGLQYDITRALTLGLDGRALLEPDGSDTYVGYEAIARAGYKRGVLSLGGDVSVLRSLENGYVGARVYGRREFGRFFGAADVLFHYFLEPINETDYAVMGSLSAGYEIGKGWSAVLSGRAGMDPFFEQQYDGLVKLVYNQTYTVREVR
jgi:hypothetical protein